MMKAFIDHDKTFGCGFVHGPGWLTDQVGFLENAYFQERPWMPITMLKVCLVQEALRNGYTFNVRFIYNDFPLSYSVSKLITEMRFRVPLFRNWKVSWLNLFRQSFYGLKPSVIVCDTGADVYQYLKYQREYLFVGFPEQFHERYVTHFFGVTRASLDENDTHGRGTILQTTFMQVRQRLQDVYGMSLSE
jgi:hypothetical protein